MLVRSSLNRHTNQEKVLFAAPTFHTFIRDRSWLNICGCAEALAPVVAEHYGAGRRGGVMTLLEPDGILNVFTQLEIGIPDQTKLGRYFAISLEKAVRTARLGADNSWNAERNPEMSQYGGAFKLPWLPLIVSFSGWSEIDDIVFTAYVLRRAGVLRESDIDVVFRQHENISLQLISRHEEFCAMCDLVVV